MVDRLRSAHPDGAERLAQIAEALRETASALDATRAALAEQKERSNERSSCQVELERLTARIGADEGERDALRQRVHALELTIGPLREDAARRSARLRDAEPRLRGAAAARSLSASLERHMSSVADGEHRRFGEAVTSSFRRLAHKDQIARIEISSDATVGLFDAAGRDVTGYSLSAGESQLFAMALIAAVGDVVGDRMPLLVDTPLGRLDTRHRESVLHMLASRRAQTVLLAPE